MERCVPKSYAGPDSVYIIKKYFTLGIYVLLLGLSGISHVFKASTEPSPSRPVLQTLPASCFTSASSNDFAASCILKDSLFNKLSYFCVCAGDGSALVLRRATGLPDPRAAFEPDGSGEQRRGGDEWSWVPGKLSPGSLSFAALFSAVTTDFLWEILNCSLNCFHTMLERRIWFEDFIVVVVSITINYLFMEVIELPIMFVLSVLRNSPISLSLTCSLVFSCIAW